MYNLIGNLNDDKHAYVSLVTKEATVTKGLHLDSEPQISNVLYTLGWWW